MAKLAINGGQPIRTNPFPSWPIFDEKDLEFVTAVLKSGKWWYGEKVREFEEKFAEFQDAKYGVSCTNGTAALEIALISAGIGAGDEVIVPPYTFIATASAVLKANAIPIFCDIQEDTFNIDPDKIESLITDNTKGIVPVHITGYPADMDKISAIANKYNLKVIEDACHSWGSKWKGKGTGALGDGGCFSFQMSKNITSGEGGVIISDNEDFADLCRSYTNCGRGKDTPWYEHYILGGNYRLTEIQAAILLTQLARLDEQTQKREENADYLYEKLSSIPFIKLCKKDSRVTTRSYHMFLFRYLREKNQGITRKQFTEAMRQEGIPLSTGYTPLYKNPLFQNKGKGPNFCPISCPYYAKDIDYSSVKLPVVEQICEEAVWIGQTVLLGTREDMDDIVKAIEKIGDNASELKS